MRRILPLSLASLVGLAGSAAAQSAGSFELDEFRPAMDSRGYLTLNGSEPLDNKEASFGLGSLDWGHHLLAVGDGAYSVNDVVTATLVGAVGVRLAGVPLEFGASLPLSIISGTTGSSDVGQQGLGDLGLHLKTRFIHAGWFGLGAIASVYLPTASPKDSFLGDGSVTPQVLAVADGTFGPLRLALNGGIRIRSADTFSAMDTTTGMMTTVTTATELPFGVAAAYAISPQKVDLIAELYGSIPLATEQNYQPLEAMGGVKVYLAKNSYLSLGAGRGLIPDRAGNPDMRAFIGIVFEPKPAVQRHALIADDIEPPPPARPPPPAPDTSFHDRDGDGIQDKDDKCPDEPGFTRDDGCPDRDRVVDVGSELVTLDPIQFEFDKAVIRPESFSILDAIVATMQGNPDIGLIEVQGHTDARGSAAYNLDLSDRRAAAVVVYLVEHGVAHDRLISHGYGSTQPVDNRATEEAYTKNRRVAFVIKIRTAH